MAKETKQKKKKGRSIQQLIGIRNLYLMNRRYLKKPTAAANHTVINSKIFLMKSSLSMKRNGEKSAEVLPKRQSRR